MIEDCCSAQGNREPLCAAAICGKSKKMNTQGARDVMGSLKWQRAIKVGNFLFRMSPASSTASKNHSICSSTHAKLPVKCAADQRRPQSWHALDRTREAPHQGRNTKCQVMPTVIEESVEGQCTITEEVTPKSGHVGMFDNVDKPSLDVRDIITPQKPARCTCSCVATRLSL